MKTPTSTGNLELYLFSNAANQPLHSHHNALFQSTSIAKQRNPKWQTICRTRSDDLTDIGDTAGMPDTSEKMRKGYLAVNGWMWVAAYCVCECVRVRLRLLSVGCRNGRTRGRGDRLAVGWALFKSSGRRGTRSEEGDVEARRCAISFDSRTAVDVDANA